MKIVTPPAVKPMTKKQAKVVRKLALGTIAELDRRGWVSGHLWENTIHTGKLIPSSWDSECLIPEWVNVPEEEAKVCLVGAASSAFNPHYPSTPGMYYDTGTDYEAFIQAVFSELPKTLQRKLDDAPGDVWMRTKMTDCIAEWNDAPRRTVKQVRALLQKVVDKHTPAPAVTE